MVWSVIQGYLCSKRQRIFEIHKKLVPMQPGDVPVTYADTAVLEEDFDSGREWI